MEENRERDESTEERPREVGSSAAAVPEKRMESISGNEREEEQRNQPQKQTEDSARLRLMEISKAVPPPDEADLNEEGHSQSPHSSASASSLSSSSRGGTEEEIRRKLMSISYSFDQPLSIPGQPVAG